MSKIIFLDVDGTLINYETVCPESAKVAVKEAVANGHKVYICTGCSKAEILQRDLPDDLSGMIGGNGAYVESDGVVVMHQALTKDEVKHIVDWCNERHLGFYEEANSGMYINQYFVDQGAHAFGGYSESKGRPFDEEMFKKHMLEAFILKEGEELYREDVNKISFILSSYQDYLDAKEEFAGMEVNTWGGRGEEAIFGDVGPSGITKKHAIEVLLDYLGADIKDTISFGDAKIDLSMFEICNYNVAMGNGGPEIKAAADYVTADVDDDGLHKAFAYLKLI